MARISDEIRQQIIERAHGRCEYCQTQQVIVVSMEVDHIIPEVAGGKTTLDNLGYACVGCNGFKLDFQVSPDPETGQEAALFHPANTALDGSFSLEWGWNNPDRLDANRKRHHCASSDQSSGGCRSTAVVGDGWLASAALNTRRSARGSDHLDSESHRHVVAFLKPFGLAHPSFGCELQRYRFSRASHDRTCASWSSWKCSKNSPGGKRTPPTHTR